MEVAKSFTLVGLQTSALRNKFCKPKTDCFGIAVNCQSEARVLHGGGCCRSPFTARWSLVRGMYPKLFAEYSNAASLSKSKSLIRYWSVQNHAVVVNPPIHPAMKMKQKPARMHSVSSRQVPAVEIHWDREIFFVNSKNISRKRWGNMSRGNMSRSPCKHATPTGYLWGSGRSHSYRQPTITRGLLVP